MEHKIEILEKPDWVSWDEIHNTIWKAHENNRSKGIYMALPALPGEKIREKIADHGKIFVALDGKRVVGTLALIRKQGDKWFNKGYYGYLCLGTVLPDYKGKGIYSLLYQVVETYSKQINLPLICFDTNEKNFPIQIITKQDGFCFVGYKACKDHFNILLAKWLNGCPYSNSYIKMRFLLSKFYIKIRFGMDKEKGKVKRFGI